MKMLQPRILICLSFLMFWPFFYAKGWHVAQFGAGYDFYVMSGFGNALMLSGSPEFYASNACYFAYQTDNYISGFVALVNGDPETSYVDLYMVKPDGSEILMYNNLPWSHASWNPGGWYFFFNYSIADLYYAGMNSTGRYAFRVKCYESSWGYSSSNDIEFYYINEYRQAPRPVTISSEGVDDVEIFVGSEGFIYPPRSWTVNTTFSFDSEYDQLWTILVPTSANGLPFREITGVDDYYVEKDGEYVRAFLNGVRGDPTWGVWVTIYYGQNGDSWDPQDDTGSGATQLNTPAASEQYHGPHTLSDTDYYDWFKVYLTAGYAYNFNSTGGSGDNYGELFSDSSGNNQVASNDDGGGGGQFAFNYTPSSSGYYYLRVRACSVGDVCSFTLKYSGVGSSVGVREALDNMALNITRGGSANWFGCRKQSVRGNNAVQSGKISHGQESWMYTRLTGPGVFRFYWSVSSEYNWDFLECYLDNIIQADISGNVNWTKKVINIPPGSHIVKWRYVKDGSSSYGSDCGWVDYATFFSHATGLREGLDNLSMSITLGGQALWVGEKCPAVYGGDAGRSGWINDGQESWMQTTIDGPKILRFYWKVSSESGSDFLEYYLDEALQAQISGETGWAKQVLTIPSGRHTVKWRYAKDGSVQSGQDSGWVDYVAVFPTPRGIESKSDIVNAHHARMIPAASDFDGDGLTDLAMVEAEGKCRVWLSGSGYASQMVYALGTAGLPAVGDFDGDGLADITMVDLDGKWTIWSSVSEYNMPLVYTLGKTGLPAAGDLDGDGLADLAIVDSEGNFIIWLSSKDAGQSISSSLEKVGSPTMGDFDGDGLADLGLLDVNGGWTVWRSGAEYSMSPTHPLGVAGWPVVGDFDGDQLPDLLVYEQLSGCFYGWLSNNQYLPVKMQVLP